MPLIKVEEFFVKIDLSARFISDWFVYFRKASLLSCFPSLSYEALSLERSQNDVSSPSADVFLRVLFLRLCLSSHNIQKCLRPSPIRIICVKSTAEYSSPLPVSFNSLPPEEIIVSARTNRVNGQSDIWGSGLQAQLQFGKAFGQFYTRNKWLAE